MNTNTNWTNPMTNLFDRDEVARIVRTGLENSVKFYTTLNENMIKMTEWQREQINETTQRHVEIINKSCEEYQKNSRVLISRIESICQKIVEQTVPATEKSEHRA